MAYAFKQFLKRSTIVYKNLSDSRRDFASILPLRRNFASSMDQREPKEIQFPVPWGYIAGKQWGPSNGKPVLGVHGWQDNAGTFDKLAPLLPPDWCFVTIDLAGHGLSSHYPPGFYYHISDFLAQIRRVVVDSLKWNKFSYIGHSMGAGLGQLFGAVYPDVIDRLVCIDLVKLVTVPCVDFRASSIGVAIDSMFQLEKKDGARAAPSYTPQEAATRLRDNTRGSLTQEAAEILIKRGTKPADEFGKVVYSRDRRIQLNTVVRLTTEQYETLMQHLTTDLLVISAKDAFKFEKQEVIDRFLKMYKRNCASFKYVEVAGNHHVHLTEPQNVASLIVSFVNEPVAKL